MLINTQEEIIQYLTACGLANDCSTADVTFETSMNACRLHVAVRSQVSVTRLMIVTVTEIRSASEEAPPWC